MEAFKLVIISPLTLCPSHHYMNRYSSCVPKFEMKVRNENYKNKFKPRRHILSKVNKGHVGQKHYMSLIRKKKKDIFFFFLHFFYVCFHFFVYCLDNKDFGLCFIFIILRKYFSHEQLLFYKSCNSLGFCHSTVVFQLL